LARSGFTVVTAHGREDVVRREQLTGERDTIAALATPPGRGGIGVVRVSGPRVERIARSVIGRLPAPRVATYCEFHDARGEAIDEGIALYFDAPNSYTGEAVLELQGHGGPVVMQTLVGACLDAGARLAEPGEFTRRAFLEGRLDLTQAEAVADLIDASSREAARSALRSLRGEFSAAVDRLVERLTELRALTEAMLDFPEEDIESFYREDALRRLTDVRAQLEATLASSQQGSILRAGIHVVIAGQPNVGKSSLLNRLAGEDRAIVTPIPGTTRDALRELVHIEGVPVNLVDTAGVRETKDEVEQLGVERTWRELSRADVVLLVVDATAGVSREDEEIVARLPRDGTLIRAFNKADLLPPGARAPRADSSRDVHVSALTGAGVSTLAKEILRAAGWASSGETVFIARERHLRALKAARAHLEDAAARLSEWELFAEELRQAQGFLSEITGEFTADDLLGEIFGRFCIGK
jgi:tRNA modification GTPase